MGKIFRFVLAFIGLYMIVGIVSLYLFEPIREGLRTNRIPAALFVAAPTCFLIAVLSTSSWRFRKWVNGALAVLIIFGSSATTVSAQTLKEIGKSVVVSVESSVNSVIETSSTQPVEGIVFNGQRWKPAQKTIRFELTPIRHLTGDLRLDVDGTIDDAPKVVDHDTGLLHPSTYVDGFLGSSKTFELGATYELNDYLGVRMEFNEHTLRQNMELVFPFGSGTITSAYQSADQYRAFGVGPSSNFHVNKFGVAATAVFYPFVSRHEVSTQRYLGRDFDNDFTHTDDSKTGWKFESKFSYSLDPHLKLFVGYNYHRLSTAHEDEEGRRTESLSMRTPTFGASVKF